MRRKRTLNLVFFFALAGCWGERTSAPTIPNAPAVRELHFEAEAGGESPPLKLELRFHPREHGDAWMQAIAGAALEAWKKCAPPEQALSLTFALEGQVWKLREDGVRTELELCMAGVLERHARLPGGSGPSPAAVVVTWRR